MRINFSKSMFNTKSNILNGNSENLENRIYEPHFTLPIRLNIIFEYRKIEASNSN